MYVWLKLIFAKSETFRDIKIIISPFVHILKICIFTKFGGSSSKNKPAAPLRSLKWFWREIHFECSKDLQIWQKVGFSWDLKMVKFWLWYLKPILNNPRLTDFLVHECPQSGKKMSIFYLFGDTWEPENQSILDYSKLVWDITTKISPFLDLIRTQLFAKFGDPCCTQNGFPAKTILNFSRARQAYFLSYYHQNW